MHFVNVVFIHVHVLYITSIKTTFTKSWTVGLDWQDIVGQWRRYWRYIKAILYWNPISVTWRGRWRMATNKIGGSLLQCPIGKPGQVVKWRWAKFDCTSQKGTNNFQSPFSIIFLWLSSSFKHFLHDFHTTACPHDFQSFKTFEDMIFITLLAISTWTSWVIFLIKETSEAVQF